MALEGTYENECMRAELLGIDKPDYDEFMKNKAEKEAEQMAALEAEAKKVFEADKEYFGHTSGKMNELGNILRSTQKKINNLTMPFSSYLKSKMGLGESAGSSKDMSQEDRAEHESDQEEYKEPVETEYTTQTKIKYPLTLEDKDKDLTLDHMPLIDEILEKTEKHALGMQYQIKQMRRFK